MKNLFKAKHVVRIYLEFLFRYMYFLKFLTWGGILVELAKFVVYGCILHWPKSKHWILMRLFALQNNMSMDGKEDYSDLPPNQKKKKLQAKVAELSKQVSYKLASKILFPLFFFKLIISLSYANYDTVIIYSF